MFGVRPEDVEEPPEGSGHLLEGLAHTPTALQEIPDPPLLGDDWVVLENRITGICGSDSKQVFMDAGGDASDFAMTAFISFPRVLGHEVIADVVEVGPKARGRYPLEQWRDAFTCIARQGETNAIKVAFDFR